MTELKKIIVGLAEYYRQALTPGQINAYAEDLADLPTDRLIAAIKHVRRASKFFPMPSEIREAAMGSIKDDALEAASRIVQAIQAYGYTNPARARAHIGELGWKVVERDGGWENVCRAIQSYDDLPTFKAQWRELARALATKNVTGREDNGPCLPASPAIAGLLSSSIKTIPGGES